MRNIRCLGAWKVTPQNFDERVLTVVALYFSFFLSAAVQG